MSNPKKKSGSGDIFSRLTDPSKYTGAHKERFDKDGKGKGLSGRDMGNEGKVSDLSQLTRGRSKTPTGSGSRSASRSNSAGPSSRAKTPTGSGSKTPTGSGSKTPTGSGSKTPTGNGSKTPTGNGSKTPTGNGKSRSRSNSFDKKNVTDVVDRLTDTSKYTGAHKARFDKEGRGLGKVGRDMGNESKITDLSQLTRANLQAAKKVDPCAPKKAGTISGVKPIPKQKFGTQAEVAKKIYVFQNADVNHSGTEIILTKAVNSMDKLLKHVTGKLKLTTGAAQAIYYVDNSKEEPKFTKVTDLDHFVDTGLYLAVGPDGIKKNLLPTKLLVKKPE